MLLRVDLSTGRVDGTSVSVHGLGSAGRLYFSGRTRLDNRSDLLGRLRLSPDVSDAELMIQAYLAFGESHPEALLGDFAYALFDARERRLWLVRDHMGVVPLYYHRAGDLCIASPSLDAMLAQRDIPRDLDDGVVAEWCVNGQVFNQTDTFYSTIKKVPRATQFCLGPSTTVTRGYWSLADIEPLKESREPILVEQLHDLLHTAILDRLGATGGQGAHLSGGLDSTPIAIVAGRACRKQGRDFHTWNWCRPEPGDERDCHEWTDARRVALTEGFSHHEIAVTPETLMQDLLEHDVARDGTTMFMYERHVLHQAQTNGVTRVFSGFGGDEILTSRSRDRHLGALRAGKFRTVLQRIALERGLERRGSYLRIIKDYARALHQVWLATPSGREAQRRKANYRVKAHLALLRPVFAAKAISYLHEPWGIIRTDRIAEQHVDRINWGYHQERLESWAILGERYRVSYVYPLLDKRLIEFALALPGEWYFRRGEARYLYRRSMNDTLPDLLNGKTKHQETERVRQLVENLRIAMSAQEVLNQITTSSSPYIDLSRLLRHLEFVQRPDSGSSQNLSFEVNAALSAILALSLNRHALSRQA
jgi:asparagine synthase (glutamine-hydrolysing)